MAVAGLACLCASHAVAQSPGALQIRGNLESNIERPLRYRPDDGDFVIENGAESFNRSLYGRNTAFRVDGGDRPEFVLYLPGRGGNLRLGLRAGNSSRWLIDARHIVTRYRPGELNYEIRDPLLGEQGVLHLQLLALHETDGLILGFRVEGAAPRSLELVAAFGGINGERGVRDGDIGTERVPISEWFQLRPEFCAGNAIDLRSDGFDLRAPAANIAAVTPPRTQFAIGDAAHWHSLPGLLSSAASASPVAIVRMPLRHEVHYFALQRMAGNRDAAPELDTYRDVTASKAGPAVADTFAPRFKAKELPAAFARTREHFRAIRERVRVRTPDPFIDAAVGALNVATDAVWDEPQQVVMHGAIAWRARLLGWRGPYATDALGWHERSRKHLSYWATRQNLSHVPATIPPAEEATNLARNPAAIHSNGDLANSHYDMNLVYIDALFRHLMWTGDLEFARRTWPVIERHLAWERRLFRREFGPEKLPLYEAYAAIWASDDLQYHGGGVTHASAYNWWHNVMAARLAGLLGHDPEPYRREAQLIARAMDEYLWLPEQGMFAEYRDYLGLQRAHPSAALWSFYHPLDAPGLVGEGRARLMMQWVAANLPRLPVRGPGIENGHSVYATTSWMPYSWSINNVVLGENMHAALAFWLARGPEEAFTLFRSTLLASMYMGISPGNVGTMNYLDVYRRESQRDFADGGGTMSRALVEGLFGIRPDALAGEIAFHPGWPAHWQRADLSGPYVDFGFSREGSRDIYEAEVRLPAMRQARLRVPLRQRSVQVRVNRRAVEPRIEQDETGREYLLVSWDTRTRARIVVEWSGAPVELPRAPALPPEQVKQPLESRGRVIAPQSKTTYSTVRLEPFVNDRVTAIFAPGKYRSPRSPFASLALPAQGIGGWAGHVNARADIDDSGLVRVAAQNGGRFLLPDGVPLAIVPGERNVIFTSQWDNYPRRVSVPLAGRARRVVLLMAGSTNYMQSRFDNGEVLVEYADGGRERLALHNPTNWWPIEQDFLIDDFQFRRPGPIPLRVDLRTGRVRAEDPQEFKGRGGVIPGGAATVLELPLDPARELRSLTVVALANEVVIGLMAATLVR